jgi:hypothetical protein
MITLRKHNSAFGLGRYADLGGSNPRVLVYVREYLDGSECTSYTAGNSCPRPEGRKRAGLLRGGLRHNEA